MLNRPLHRMELACRDRKPAGLIIQTCLDLKDMVCLDPIILSGVRDNLGREVRELSANVSILGSPDPEETVRRGFVGYGVLLRCSCLIRELRIARFHEQGEELVTGRNVVVEAHLLTIRARR